MELRTNRAVLLTDDPSECIVQEQGVELDYVLPDYFPDVQRLVKCLVSPTITSYAIDGNRLTYELCAEIRILYCSPTSHVLQCVTQLLRFSRTAELPAEHMQAELLPVTDYANCRAVSSRRLDVRGAVTIRIRTTSARQQEAVSDVFAEGIQLRKIPVQFPARNLSASPHIVLAEELELNTTQPAVLHIVRCHAKPVEESHKIVSGKLLVQGSLQVQLLYACEKEGNALLEPMQFRIPYSQLAELDGLEEQDFCFVHASVISCDIKPVANDTGDIRLLRCEAELQLHCHAIRMASEQLVCDAFSTLRQCELSTTHLLTGGKPIPFSENLTCSVTLASPDGEPDCVYDAWCDIRNLSTRLDTEAGCLLMSGMLCCNVFIREPDGMPRLLEKEEPFEHRLPIESLSETDTIQLYADVENCSYTLSNQGEIVLKADLRLHGIVRQYQSCHAVTDIQMGNEPLSPQNFALKLYFGREKESVWEIAKRCCTSVEAIMEENDLSDDCLSEDGMLLIPLVR